MRKVVLVISAAFSICVGIVPAIETTDTGGNPISPSPLGKFYVQELFVPADMMLTDDSRCEHNAVLAKESELANYCTDFLDTGEWAIKGDSGKLKKLQTRYDGNQITCNVIDDDTASQYPSICMMKEQPSDQYAFVFGSYNYSNSLKAFSGKGEILLTDQKQAYSNANSMRIGQKVKIEAYSEPEFRGHKKIFTDSFSISPFPIKSYRVLAL